MNPWPPSNNYPPLPPPTRDETAFLEEIAALGEEWPQIMNEAIENRISNARLEASLPRFESFGFDNSSHAPASNSTPSSFHSNQSYHSQAYSPHQNYPDNYAPLPPASSFHPSSAPPSHLPTNDEYDQRNPGQLLQYLGNQQDQPTPLAEPRAFMDERDRSQNEGGWRTDAAGEANRGMIAHDHSNQNGTSRWWEQPQPPPAQQQSYNSHYSNVEFENRSVPPPLHYAYPQSTILPHSQFHEQQPRYRPFPPSLPPPPVPVSQLPYQPPSREWNQALPAPYPTWEQHQNTDPRLMPTRQHYHETSSTSIGSNNLVPAGLTYATSSTSQSTDHSRQSSTTTHFTDFNSANEQMFSTSFNSVAGIGKRARFDSANYSRPPLNPQLHDTPSSSSQATSSSSSSLPTTASLETPSSHSVSPPIHRTSTTTTTSKSGPSTGAQAVVTGNRRGNKTKAEVPISCVSCGRKLARLILRGQKHDLEVPYEASFHCLNCADGGGGGGAGMEESPGASSISERSPSESSQIGQGSGGLSSRRTSTVSTSTSTPSSTATPSMPTVPTTFRKKNKRLDAGQATLTACDVCLMDRAKGSVLPREPEKGHTIDFQIEVVCVSCDEKYQRCSDCGGGGGVRLGTGKWRSKELFKDGKKTCSLRHQRLGAFPEMEYQVWKNTEIPRDELDEVSEKCGELFTNQMLGAIAIPEVLERNGAIWTSFAEAQSHAYSGWKGMDPMIRYDVEPSQGIRRYLALRLCAPNLRKTTRKADLPPPVETPRNGQIFKGDKEIVGYIIAEWDMKRGVLFLALVIPWDATGEAYDATTLLLQALCTRVQNDEREENELRARRGEALLPSLERVFTMLFFKTGSRMITQLTKKRGFAPSDEYFKMNPQADPLAFPPHRPIYLPVERQRGWIVLIRTLQKNADGTIDDWSARRSADEERGKRKEARARAMREKKEKEHE